MAVNLKVKAFLDEKNIDYEIVKHEKVFSTAEEARALGVAADEIAKTLVVHITHTGSQALIIIPGGQKISGKKVQHLLGSKHARLALEPELSRDFPDFELGAVPPLGPVVDLPAYIDRRLVVHETILFSAGSHSDSIKMSVHDFLNIADAALVDVVEEPLAA